MPIQLAVRVRHAWPSSVSDDPKQRSCHWCENEDCQKLHYADDSGDRWVCPRNRDHWWSEEDYRRWVADVYEANRSAS